MKHDVRFLFFSIFLLVSIPGCGRLIDWGKKSVDQGENLKENIDVAKNKINSSRIYDQFTLVGAFDSLWLDDDVRQVYASVYAMKQGKTDTEKKIFLRRQFEENNHFISFYVLSPADIVIGEKDSEWTVLLSIGNYKFAPTEFKKIELSSEYKHIFGKKFNRFKTAYILRFNAKDIEDHFIIEPTTEKISLLFRTTKKEVAQTWSVKKNA